MLMALLLGGNFLFTKALMNIAGGCTHPALSISPTFICVFMSSGSLSVLYQDVTCGSLADGLDDVDEVLLDATMALTVLSGFHYALVASRRISLLEAQSAPEHTL